jgi:hypothetical protein
LLQRIQYALLLFIPSLLGRPIKCLAFKQYGSNTNCYNRRGESNNTDIAKGKRLYRH